MTKFLSLVALPLLAAYTGVSGNGGTKMYGEITIGVETGRTTLRR